eukprot:TRINITY_DN13650_c1_g1_i1.p1 TRINITY_DN13650_c1_g1~~TRINITY_DN13650_c1_g1_i1.p1  ORF type:complete len:261 (-),score=34.14 TRINITY_DN13650_c1_g1_i1:52-771(-)
MAYYFRAAAILIFHLLVCLAHYMPSPAVDIVHLSFLVCFEYGLFMLVQHADACLNCARVLAPKAFGRSLQSVFRKCSRFVRGSVHDQATSASPFVASPSSPEGENGACPSESGGSVDFPHCTYDKSTDVGISRFIKIECPGVDASGVEIEHFLNGCVINLKRPASDGMKEASWTKRFHFEASNGSFEFKEDQAQLNNGVLEVVFAQLRHTFLFPSHAAKSARRRASSKEGESDVCYSQR